MSLPKNLVNRAAYVLTPKAHPLTIRPASLAEPTPTQIVIKNHALAMNPIDVKLQRLAVYPIAYPAILGQDVAGTVVAVGSEVANRFKTGDRVLGTTAGFLTKKETEKGFQEYTALETSLTCHVPEQMKFEEAVMLPLAVTTAAAGLFNEDFLRLKLPTEPRREGSGEVLVVWGGSSNVGGAAIQLAVAAGYEVVTTASAKNFELMKKIGAKQTFDYKSEKVVEEIVQALKGKKIVGAFDAVGGDAWAKTVEIVKQCEGGKFVATAVRGFADPPEGIAMKQVFALSIKDNGVGKAVWEDFLPKALQAGTFVAPSEPVIAGNGLESVQAALDLLAKGVSAQKVVVTL